MLRREAIAASLAAFLAASERGSSTPEADAAATLLEAQRDHWHELTLEDLPAVLEAMAVLLLEQR